MTPGARRAKGQRLPKLVAEAIARQCALTIEASHPKFIGTRHGVRYVLEGTADLRIRASGQPGCDVAIVGRPRRVARLKHPLLGWPSIECKNSEAWAFDAKLWATGQLPQIVVKALLQALGHTRDHDRYPVVVLGKNHWPPLAVVPDSVAWRSVPSLRVMLRKTPFLVVPLRTWVASLGGP